VDTNFVREIKTMKLAGSFLLTVSGFLAFGQQPAVRPDAKTSSGPEQKAASAEQRPKTDPDYILGPGDQIVVRVLNAEEINDKPVLVDMGGFIRLPVVGRVKVGGLTVSQVESQLASQLKSYLLHPDVSVAIAEYHSQPVSVIGSVKNPGVQQVQGRKSLVEMLSLVGGLEPTAGPTLKITRKLENGRIPLPDAKDDLTGGFSVAELNVKSLLEAKRPEENILILPHDVISIPRAETVYVMGQVQKAGGFVLTDRTSMTVLQAISMAGGFDKTAKPQNSVILRRAGDGDNPRTEVAVDLRKILDRKAPDVPMQPEDILYVPDNIPKKAALRGLEAAIQLGTGIAVFRR